MLIFGTKAVATLTNFSLYTFSLYVAKSKQELELLSHR